MTRRTFCSALIALAAFFAVVTALNVAAHRAKPPEFPPDVMVKYADIVPGAPRSTLVGFSCYAAWMEVGYCYHAPADGDVRGIYVALDSAGHVRHVSFSLRGARLLELERVFGRATSRSEAHTRYADLYTLCFGNRARAVIAIRPYGVSTYLSMSSDAIYVC